MACLPRSALVRLATRYMATCEELRLERDALEAELANARVECEAADALLDAAWRRLEEVGAA